MKDETVVGNDRVKHEARTKILDMRKHRHFLRDDYQRWGYDNFLSGCEFVYRLLTGEEI